MRYSYGSLDTESDFIISGQYHVVTEAGCTLTVFSPWSGHSLNGDITGLTSLTVVQMQTASAIRMTTTADGSPVVAVDAVTTYQIPPDPAQPHSSAELYTSGEPAQRLAAALADLARACGAHPTGP
jgi:hypothetical protein